MTCDQAAQAVAEGKELTCEELDQANKDARKNELDNDNTPEGFALTTAVGTNKNGVSGFMKGVSSGDAPKKEFKNGYAPAVKAKTRPDCSGAGGYDAQRKNDSETKVLDPFMRSAGSGGSVTMKVYHRSVAGGVTTEDEMPCISCRKSICGAEKCGITVTLCNKNNEKVKAADMCDDGKPKGTGSTSDPLWTNAGFA
ncbi:hypothetical protein [Luteolibacter sp. Populi]|uniref:hypothetical protein n=1 Tax=Luteolibacter sp. Populi TaxID=3230487 RepID=UPI003466F440